MDEAWFYLISLAIEAAGAPAVPAIVDCLHAIERGDTNAMINALIIMASAIDEINKILPRMYEKVTHFPPFLSVIITIVFFRMMRTSFSIELELMLMGGKSPKIFQYVCYIEIPNARINVN
jgi:hypothetical protein